MADIMVRKVRLRDNVVRIVGTDARALSSVAAAGTALTLVDGGLVLWKPVLVRAV